MYRRYMVFGYTTYDNEEPFQCVRGTFDDLEVALKVAESLKDKEDPECSRSCVFDRIAGEMISY